MRHCSHRLGSGFLPPCNHEAAWSVSRREIDRDACRKHLSAVAEEMTAHDRGVELIIQWIWAPSPERPECQTLQAE